MKQKDVFTLDKKDDHTVQLFSKLGMPKNLAKILICMSHYDECKCADVEQGADLRQPEVSIAMKELRRRGWITKRDLKKEGKGRPTHIYKTNSNLQDILKTVEQEKLNEAENMKKDLLELKNIMLKI